jgi:hypothetical protein
LIASENGFVKDGGRDFESVGFVGALDRLWALWARWTGCATSSLLGTWIKPSIL